MVCETIYGSGMDGFYRRISYQQETVGNVLQPPPEMDSELEVYDLDDVQREFVDDLSEIREIHLLLTGIHCAACVWLIEHRLANEVGILDANVNLSAQPLHP